MELYSDRHIPLRIQDKKNSRPSFFSTVEEELVTKYSDYNAYLFDMMFERTTTSCREPTVLCHRKSLGNVDNLERSKKIHRRKKKITPPKLTCRFEGFEGVDDFYCNPLDWSNVNTLAIGIGNEIFFWNSRTEKMSNLQAFNDSHNFFYLTDVQGYVIVDNNITSVKWSNHESHLLLGFGTGLLELWDVQKQKMLKSFQMSVNCRLATMAVLPRDNFTFLTGNANGEVGMVDIRSKNVGNFTGGPLGSGEICGLAVNSSGNKIAAGSNDNNIYICDLRCNSLQLPVLENNNRDVFKLEGHVAAVKALAWHPNKSDILASGGGSADKNLKIWNLTTDTHSTLCINNQVCGIHWLDENYLTSVQGFCSKSLSILEYDHQRHDLSNVLEMTNIHEKRIIGSSFSHDVKMLSTIDKKELNIWNFDGVIERNSRRDFEERHSKLNYYTIR